MRQFRNWLIALACVSASFASAQQPAPEPRDVASADAIIAALYDANSTMVDQKRGADRFRSLFTADGRLMAAGIGRLNTHSVEQYVTVAMAGSPRHGFSERETARTTAAFGRILHAFSTYEARADSTDKRPTRGINSIQLFNDGRRWWVVSVLWDVERPDNPIPAAYRP